MRLPTPFIQLPLWFDVARLRTEIQQFPETEWRAHPQGFPGNSALILVSHNGVDNDDTEGEMAPTPRLAQCPYLQQVLASFHAVIGRSRLMRLAPGSEVKPHSDIDYYWRDRIRIHVPIVTAPQVLFNCDGMEIHMGAGEAWIFDNWRPHRVLNNSRVTRIHLVIDTVGSAAFWRLVSRGSAPGSNQSLNLEKIIFDPDKTSNELAVERINTTPVASPAMVKSVVHDLITDLRNAKVRNSQELELESILVDLANDWQATWAIYGDSVSGYGHYASMLQYSLKTIGQRCRDATMPSNGQPAALVLQRYLPPLFGGFSTFLAGVKPPEFSRPLIIVAAPRSGSTLLFEILARHPELWSLQDEGHAEIENISGLAPRDRNYESNALTADDLTPERRSALLRNITLQLVNGRGEQYLGIAQDQRPPRVRFLEKTPKNALRMDFLNSLFPDAHYLFLYRDAAGNLGSMLDAWHSGRFVTYPDLPDWQGPPWSLLLIPGWQNLSRKPLAEITLQQWQLTNETILENLTSLPESRWRVLDYDMLTRNPSGVFSKISAWLDLRPMPQIEKTLSIGVPYSRHTLTPPARDKWRRYEYELSHVLSVTRSLADRLAVLGNRL